MPYIIDQLDDDEKVKIQCINKVVVATKGEMRQYWAIPTTMKLDDIIYVPVEAEHIMLLFTASKPNYGLRFKPHCISTKYVDDCIKAMIINIYGAEQLNNPIQDYAEIGAYIYSDTEDGMAVVSYMQQMGYTCVHVDIFDHMLNRYQATINSDKTLTWVEPGDRSFSHAKLLDSSFDSSICHQLGLIDDKTMSDFMYRFDTEYALWKSLTDGKARMGFRVDRMGSYRHTIVRLKERVLKDEQQIIKVYNQLLNNKISDARVAKD